MFTMSQKNISVACQVQRTSRLSERFDCQPEQMLNDATIDAGSDVTFILIKATSHRLQSEHETCT